MNTAAVFHGFPQAFSFPQAFKQPFQSTQTLSNDLTAPGRVLQASYEEMSLSSNSSVQVSLSSDSMKLAYQVEEQISYRRVSFLGAQVSDVTRPTPATALQSPDKSAETILNFIENHLKELMASGAGSEEIDAALQQGLAGFKQGRDEAIDILKGYGMYEGPIIDGVDRTTTLVEDGIAKLREAYLPGTVADTSLDSAEETVDKRGSVETPTAATPIESPIVKTQNSVRSDTPDSADNKAVSAKESDNNRQHNKAAIVASYRERFMASETVDLKIQTRDGDTVSLSFAGLMNFQQQGRLGTFYQSGERGDGLGLAVQHQSASSYAARYEFSVDGDLDDGELQALQDLIGQIRDLADNFFSGDMEKAFEQAASLSMDMNELTSMSMKLTQTQAYRAETAYRSVADMGDEPSKNRGHSHEKEQQFTGMHRLGMHNRSLLDMLQTAEAFAHPKDVVSNLFALSFAQMDAQRGEKNAEKFQSLNDRLLNQLEKFTRV